MITKLTYEDSENDGDLMNKRSLEKRVRRQSCAKRDRSGGRDGSEGRDGSGGIDRSGGRDGSGGRERWSKRKGKEADDKEWKPRASGK